MPPAPLHYKSARRASQPRRGKERRYRRGGIGGVEQRIADDGRVDDAGEVREVVQRRDFGEQQHGAMARNAGGEGAGARSIGVPACAGAAKSDAGGGQVEGGVERGLVGDLDDRRHVHRAGDGD